ncbi:MAG: hypothetical protein O3B24_03840 [Verrucomicrobia bacterium]|nr:hypothetical protein [Verrucomicrobiota bacterium]
MRLFSKETTSYAVLLVTLFAIAAVAVRHVLAMLEDRLSAADAFVATILICVITFGFMLIAGAFGLWGMRMSAATEGRRKVGLLIEAMDYIQDGLIALDRKGRITGSNPAVKRMAGREVEPESPITTLFPCLTEEDTDAIMDARDPLEIERRLLDADGARTLRFRSQPIEGMTLLLVSDVTRVEALRLHNRLVARLQLIGQIARGVAYDFNNLLCAISGHASLLARLPPDSPDAQRSLRAIGKGADRGTALAAHLLELSSPNPSAAFPRMSPEYLQVAISALRDSLPEGWQVDGQISDVPPMSLAGIKIEQVVLNLGLLIAERATTPGRLRIVVDAPRKDDYLLNVGHQFAGVLLIAAVPMETVAQSPILRDDSSSSGVIISVIRSMIDQANGILECLRSADGAPIYRVSLPHELPAVANEAHEKTATDLAPYVANWHVMLVTPDQRHYRVSGRLREIGVHVVVVKDFMTALTQMEDNRPLDSIVVDERALPMEGAALLRAVVKLCPASAIVVLAAASRAEDAALGADVVFARYTDSPDRILLTMIEARSLAVRRRPPVA